MADAGHKRRNYFIKKKFQLKYTFLIVAMLLVVMIVSGVGLYVGMWSSIIENFSKFKVSENLENVRRITDYEQVRFRRGDVRLEKIFREAELLSEKERQTLEEALRSVNKSLVPKVLVLAIVIFIGGIFVSHKIAGPMYRFEQSAEAITHGDLSVNFRVRKNDEMKDTAMTLEEMVESLRHDIEKIKIASTYLKDAVGSLKGDIPPKEAEHLKKVSEEIYAIVSKYKI